MLHVTARTVSLFQFHYGTIIRKNFNVYPIQIDQFQFHYGTIISFSPKVGTGTVPAFQFHYGTIISVVRLFCADR